MSNKVAERIKKAEQDLAHDERGSFSLPAPIPHLPHVHVPHAPQVDKLTKKLFIAIKKQYILLLSVLGYVLIATYLYSFLAPKNINFSYAGDNCFSNVTILPNLHKANSEAYRVTNRGGLSIAGHQLTSTSTCLTLVSPKSGTERVSLAPSALTFLEKKIEIRPTAPPKLSALSTIELIPTSVPLEMELNQADKVFEYSLSANEQAVTCEVRGSELNCDTSELSLKQSTEYSFKLERFLGASPAGVVFEETISTVDAVKVVKSSIKNGTTVYDKPNSIEITFSKEIDQFDKVAVMASGKEIKSKATITKNKKTLEVEFLEELPRKQEINVSIGQVVAPDYSSLAKPYTLKFKTSGGPKVASSSIGNYGVYTSSNITLSFDSAPAKDQNIASFFSVTVGGNSVAANVYHNGKSVTINPKKNLPFCTNFKVSVKAGLRNVHGIDGGSAWSKNSRTICHSVSSIGKSVRGRNITSYTFGSGSKTILFFGSMHGNEASAKYTLASWINELEAKYNQIPKGTKVVVIPSLNPDGIATGSRYNANGVDLNRNFPEANWQKDVDGTRGGTIVGGGGTAPLSEPEASALANYVLATRPSLILSYHAVGSVVISNLAGNANSKASTYSANTGYWVSNGGDIFDYDITGSFEDWLYESHGIPTLVIELPSYYGNHFYGNRSAMWAMIK